jgi:ELWxxDGT repeat protein
MGIFKRRFTPLQRRITLEQLEERVMLDASGAAQAQDQPDDQATAEASGGPSGEAQAVAPTGVSGGGVPQSANTPPETAQVFQQDLKIVLISNDVKNIEEISRAASPDAKVIVFDALEDGTASVVATIDELSQTEGKPVGAIAVLAHGAPGVIEIGADRIDFFNLESFRTTFEDLGRILTEDAQIHLYGCDIAADVFGQALTDRIARYTSADVFAGDDLTGGARGDWNLEYASTSGLTLAPILNLSLLDELDTALPARRLTDINPGAGGSDPSQLTVMNGGVMFSADGGVDGLWWANLSEVRQLTGGTTYVHSWAEMINVNGTLFFPAAGNDGTGYELWKTDGTPGVGHTEMVMDVNPGVGDSLVSPAWGAKLMADLNGILLFAANDGSHGVELWRSDGTEAGTYMVKDINAGSGWGIPAFTGSGDPAPWSVFTVVNGTLFFAADDGSHGIELWRSDGTPGGTTMVSDVNSFGDSIVVPDGSGAESLFMGVGNHLVFTAKDGPAAGLELWSADASGASKIGAPGFEPTFFASMGDHVYFRAADPTYGEELWRTDGVSVSLVKDIVPGTDGSHPFNMTNVNGTLYFAAGDPDHGVELWKSDGTAAGTVLVKDINAGPDGSMDVSGYPFIEVTDTLAFWADDGVNGKRLWQSDGTSSGTIMSPSITEAGVAGGIEWVHVNPLYFAYDGGDGFGRELWVWTPDPVPGPPAVPVPGPTSADAFSFQDSEGLRPPENPFAASDSLAQLTFTSHDVDFWGDRFHDSGDLSDMFADDVRAHEKVFEPVEPPWLSVLGDRDAWLHAIESARAPRYDAVCGLYGFHELVQEGKAIVFNPDEISVAMLLDDGADYNLDVELAVLDPDDYWQKLVDQCGPKCVGSRALMDLLLQSRPQAVWEEQTVQGPI